MGLLKLSGVRQVRSSEPYYRSYRSIASCFVTMKMTGVSRSVLEACPAVFHIFNRLCRLRGHNQGAHWDGTLNSHLSSKAITCIQQVFLLTLHTSMRVSIGVILPSSKNRPSEPSHGSTGTPELTLML